MFLSIEFLDQNLGQKYGEKVDLVITSSIDLRKVEISRHENISTLSDFGNCLIHSVREKWSIFYFHYDVWYKCFFISYTRSESIK